MPLIPPRFPLRLRRPPSVPPPGSDDEPGDAGDQPGTRGLVATPPEPGRPATSSGPGPLPEGAAEPRPRLRLSWRQLGQLPVTMMLASVLAGLGAVQMTFLIGNSLYRTFTREQATAQLRQDVSKLQQDLAVLQAAKAHANDPDELRAQARCLGFVGANEQVVVAQGATEADGGNCDPVRLP